MSMWAGVPAHLCISTTPSSGRGLSVAPGHRLLQGEVALSIPPTAVCIAARYAGHTCHCCLRRFHGDRVPPMPLRCAECLTASWCSAGCQQRTARRHATECSYLKRLGLPCNREIKRDEREHIAILASTLASAGTGTSISGTALPVSDASSVASASGEDSASVVVGAGGGSGTAISGTTLPVSDASSVASASGEDSASVMGGAGGGSGAAISGTTLPVSDASSVASASERVRGSVVGGAGGRSGGGEVDGRGVGWACLEETLSLMEEEWGRPGAKKQKRAMFDAADKVHAWGLELSASEAGPSGSEAGPEVTCPNGSNGSNGSSSCLRPGLQALQRLLTTGPLNDFGLWNEEGECMGRCVAPVVALVNHSCVPNCAQVVTSLVTSLVTPGGRFEEFPVREAHVRLVALRDIEAGEELSQCYVNLLDADRAAVIQRSWRFRCRCARCGAGPQLKSNQVKSNKVDPAVAAFDAAHLCCCGGVVVKRHFLTQPGADGEDGQEAGESASGEEECRCNRPQPGVPG